MKIVFVSGSRADWRLVQPMLTAAQGTPHVFAELILTGTHLSNRHGHTGAHVRAAGFQPLAQIEILTQEDSPAAITRATGKAVADIGQVLAQHPCDWVVVVGDRYESFAAGLAATMLGISLLHVAGGETDVATNQDGNLRNALTKLAQAHCVANEMAHERLLSLGEEPWRISITGLPSLDQLESDAGDRSLLEQSGWIPLNKPFILASFLPVTLEAEAAAQHLETMLSALEAIDLPKLWVLSNADAGGDQLDARISEWARRCGDVILSPALTPEQYATALKHAAAYVGNSSSGAIESPIFGTPSVIVGRRQQGRAVASNVTVLSEPDSIELTHCIREALAEDRTPVASPFGDGHAAPRIIDFLQQMHDRSDLISKRLIVRSADQIVDRMEAGEIVPATGRGRL